MKKILANLEEIVACVFLTVLIVLVSVNVLLRFVTTHSINWANEIIYLCFAYVIFLGGSAAFKRNMHSGIDILVRVLPEKMQAVIAVVTTACLLVTCGSVTWLSFLYAVGSGAKKTAILRIPYFYIDISATIGFAMMCIHCIMFIYHIFKYKDYFRSKPLYDGIFTYASADEEMLEILKGDDEA